MSARQGSFDSTGGGLTFGQVPCYNGVISGNTQKWLPVYLQPYLGLPDPKSVGTTAFQLVPTFVCPSYMSIWSAGTIDHNGGPLTNPHTDNFLSYANNGNAMGAYSLCLAPKNTPNGASLNAAFPDPPPAGSSQGPYPFGKGSSLLQPLSLSQITGAGVSLSTLWSIADADEVASSGLVKPGCALKPVHLSVRCYAYFDGHAATGKVNFQTPFLGTYEQ